MLFEVAIIERPSKKEEEEGAVEKLVFGPKAVVARDPSGAVIAAVLRDPDKPVIDLDKAEVLVRPFVDAPSGYCYSGQNLLSLTTNTVDASR